jgi:hypothetical protein
MHFLVVSIAFCLMTLANVHADLTDCTPPNSPVKINQIILTPNPPKIGQPLTINGTATVSMNLSVFSYFFILLARRSRFFLSMK